MLVLPYSIDTVTLKSPVTNWLVIALSVLMLNILLRRERTR